MITRTPFDMIPPTDPVCYWLDPSDRIIAVNDAWNDFARLNDTPGLQSPHIIGASLWNSIHDATTRQLYEAMLRRVRLGHATEYEYRCDSPALKRRMHMRVEVDADRVRFTSAVVAIEPCAGQAIWRAGIGRSGDLLRVCGWCKRISVADQWLEAEHGIAALRLFESPALPMLTHGICTDCIERMTALIDT